MSWHWHLRGIRPTRAHLQDTLAALACGLHISTLPTTAAIARLQLCAQLSSTGVCRLSFFAFRSLALPRRLSAAAPPAPISSYSMLRSRLVLTARFAISLPVLFCASLLPLRRVCLDALAISLQFQRCHCAFPRSAHESRLPGISASACLTFGGAVRLPAPRCVPANCDRTAPCVLVFLCLGAPKCPVFSSPNTRTP